MANIRNHQPKKYTVLDNRGLDCPDISFRATGLWAYVKSKPANWEISVSHLAKQKTEGRDAIYKAINELIAAGLVIKSQVRDGGKFGEIHYDFYDSPQVADLPDTDSQDTVLPLTEKPDTDSPDTGKPDTANPTLINTELINTDSETITERVNAPEKIPPQESSPEQTSQLIGVNRKPDPYFDNRRNLNESRQAIANQNSVKDSPFESVEEMDNFYAYAFAELSKNSKKFRPDIENEAKWMVLRLQRGQDDPRDRQYLSQFRTGLTRVSREDELLAFAEAVQADLMRKYAS